MSKDSIRLDVTLPSEYGEKLSRLAGRTHVAEGALARLLLDRAIDDADPDARDIVALLDRVPGAWDRVEAGIADVRAGHVISLDEP